MVHGFWEATRQEISHNLPPSDIEGRRGIQWGLGPIRVDGYFDTNTFEIGPSVSVVGIDIGTIYGNLKDGTAVRFNLGVANGEIRFYLKNGNQVWTYLDTKVTFNGQYSGDYKIMEF
ncbi:hypothetical protein N7478_009291 [Penicillium angulare]|uniref:uncharacterized protein n=1 Tax=Penicillium angulare TaxID=116970 RepID=UPI0025414BE5|nr:uncharacterized protein N7478_009291 [Penicillium angulare]KAJ5266483.1 hypothetical protein N7478_009291 [Penicillium angulare]